ncbi:MAG: hypothetical protein LBB74_09175 [Chitinispirillales bacterium]|jgi:hypothetical protein|nr:hypothetical protein [Chitinispirillales bacterium]
MRFNRLYPLSALIGAAILILFCSRTDVITDAGSSAVTDFNPGLTDLDRGFATFTRLDTAVGTAFSLPASPDPLFGTFIADNILIGLSDDNDTLAAHILYDVPGDTSYAPGDSLIRAYMCFRAADSVSGGAAIALFHSDPLPGFTPVNRADNNAGNGAAGSFSLRGTDVCTLQLRDDLADSLFRARASRDTGLHSPFAFSIVDYTGPLIKMDNPYIVVERVRRVCCDNDTLWALSDTLRGSTRYSAFEDAAQAAERANEPYSSQITQRTAVFRINVGKILDSLSLLGLSGGNSELLDAVLTVRYHRDSTAAGARAKMRSRNVGNFKALILDTLLRKDIDTLSESGAHLLRYRFTNVNLLNPATPYTSLPFKTVLRDVIRKYTPGIGDTAYVYVYLRATVERGTIWWCKPEKTYPPNIPSVTVETVFTPYGLHRGNDINQ